MKLIEKLKAVVEGKEDILTLSLSDRAKMRALGWVGRDINGNSYVTKKGKLAVKASKK